ncbi:MAG: type I-E CRISPR-associated protein Cse1/CasA [Deltaproteobacteria bacterium]|nr:type I-E CRISPR-associated protein Cse1/CasA [Deltaproteobacteria bacterium]
MPLSFDLRDTPWIVVETHSGAFLECSTRQVLRDAHTLRAIVDESPLVIATLTRHLLAILHRVYDGPKTLRAWQTIVRAGHFDPAAIDAYLDSDSVKDRMDLFHPTHPFAQTRGLVGAFSKYTRAIDELEVVRSSWGGGRVVFRHRPDDGTPITMAPARAARALLAHHGFATGGLIKFPGEPTSATNAPLLRNAVIVLRGHSLFQTLVSNLLPGL